MYKEKTHQVEDRIVSIHQPYVRPIKRGKVHVDAEIKKEDAWWPIRLLGLNR